MSYARIERAANACHLTLLGGFHPSDDPSVPENCQTILLLGPDEPAFWPAFVHSPEWRDGNPDPVDRWSKRVVDRLASDFKATPLYPFGGPPFQPFYTWALKTKRIHSSPVNLLVHDQAGLFVSFRGALALQDQIDLPDPAPSPCTACSTQPCATACPASALTTDGYDVPKCKSFLATPEGTEHMALGCNVRRSCPVSQKFGRISDQSAYHMRQFSGD